MSDYTVSKYGTDSSGRDIYMTAHMHDWLEARWANLGFEVAIEQGAFMLRNGGGAANSQGFHDLAGCIDFRTRDMSDAKIDAMVKEFRDHGGALWRRDLTPRHGGMPKHAHLTLGSDFPLSEGAIVSWHSYVTGGDGLGAGPGRPSDARDYEYRPNPLVLVPPEEDMPNYREWQPADRQALAQDIADAVWAQTIQVEGEAKPRLIKNAISKILTAVKGA